MLSSCEVIAFILYKERSHWCVCWEKINQDIKEKLEDSDLVFYYTEQLILFVLKGSCCSVISASKSTICLHQSGAEEKKKDFLGENFLTEDGKDFDLSRLKDASKAKGTLTDSNQINPQKIRNLTRKKLIVIKSFTDQELTS